MKKNISIILTAAMIFTLFSVFTVTGYTDEDFTLEMQIDNPIMKVNGTDREIDPGMGTSPVIRNDRTLVPIRAIIEAMGGSIDWEAETRTVMLNYDDDEIRLVIDSETAYLNGGENTLDSAPVIINNRTMLPIRFIAESFNFDVDWMQETRTITIIKAETQSAVTAEPTIEPTSEPEITSEPTDEPDAGETGTIVVYFSRAGEQYGVGVIDKGNTAVIADMIIEATGADEFEILPKDADRYPTTSYDALKDVAAEEKDSNARPEIASEIEDFDSYDTVFIGYPIWWGDMPMIVYNFLESYDFDGKTVIPFCTHGGSGLAGTERTISGIIGDANMKKGLAVAGTTAQNNRDNAKSAVDEWLADIGYTEE
ncbi:MAG: NAD(P)H-dependent oxidoreductase [Oscillospiraceae bacterium]|nr:NAD(P)H-dependent oxidoreductase [Oscillospiraceae bacterium]